MKDMIQDALWPRSLVDRSIATEPDPISQFERWLAEAIEKGVSSPTAMALATTDASGQPDVRIVILQHVDERGFVFCTNLESAKASELRGNSRAALCFLWSVIDRQVRVRGRSERIADAEADAFFANKPRGAQIGAWASKQSRPMDSRFDLDRACAAYALRNPVGIVPRPPFWSGYRVVPDRIEFWFKRVLGRPDRVRYDRKGRQWAEQRLFP